MKKILALVPDPEVSLERTFKCILLMMAFSLTLGFGASTYAAGEGRACLETLQKAHYVSNQPADGEIDPFAVTIETPSFWRSAGRFLKGNFRAFKDYRNTKKQLAENTKAREVIIEARTSALAYAQRLINRTESQIDAQLMSDDIRLMEAFSGLRKATSLQQITTEIAKIETVLHEAIRLTATHKRAFRTIESSLAEARKIVRQGNAKLELAVIEKNHRAILNSIRSEAQLNSELLTLRNTISGIVKDFQNTLLARQQKEKRFRLKTPGNSSEIYKSYLALVENLYGVDDAEVLWLRNQEDITTSLMETNALTKQFIYREMQFSRRVSFALLKMPEVNQTKVKRQLKERLVSNRLAQEFEGGSLPNKLQKLMSLRSIVRALANKNALVSQLNLQSSRSLNLFEREKVLRDALRHPEISHSLLAVAMKSPARPQPPSPPKKPTNKTIRLPSAPYKPYKFRSRHEVEAYKRAYARYVEDCKKVIENVKAKYKANVLQYKINLAKNQAESMRATDFKIQKQRAIEFIALYLTGKFHDFNLQVRNSEVVLKSVEEHTQIRQELYRQKIGAKYTNSLSRFAATKGSKTLLNSSLAASKGTLSTATSSPAVQDDMFMFHMLLAFYTNNPLWLISRDIALIQSLSYGSLYGNTQSVHALTRAECEARSLSLDQLPLSLDDAKAKLPEFSATLSPSLDLEVEKSVINNGVSEAMPSSGGVSAISMESGLVEGTVVLESAFLMEELASELNLNLESLAKVDSEMSAPDLNLEMKSSDLDLKLDTDLNFDLDLSFESLNIEPTVSVEVESSSYNSPSSSYESSSSSYESSSSSYESSSSSSESSSSSGGD